MTIKQTFLLLPLLLLLASCQSKKAITLKESLEKKDRIAFSILVGKNGPNEQKLNCLIKSDFGCAIAAIAQQEQEFDKLIGEIKSLETNGIKEGEALKKATADYYQAVKELQTFERLEIAQQQISNDKTNTDKVRDEAMRKQGELLKQKQEMYKTVYQREATLGSVQKQFDAANRLN